MELSYLLIGGSIVLVIAIFAMGMNGNAVTKAMKVAASTKDVQPVIEAIDADKNADIPTIYNTCIKKFWDTYNREPATDLIRALLERNDSAPISQHWLKTVRDVEPELARKQLGEDFILSHFKEDIAAQCGSCCGGSCSKSKCKSCKS